MKLSTFRCFLFHDSWLLLVLLLLHPPLWTPCVSAWCSNSGPSTLWTTRAKATARSRTLWLAPQADDDDDDNNPLRSQPDNSDNHDNDDGWGDVQEEQQQQRQSNQLQELKVLQQQASSQSASTNNNNNNNATTQERDLFIPIFAIVSLMGLFGAYGYEMIRLYSRGELYLPSF